MLQELLHRVVFADDVLDSGWRRAAAALAARFYWGCMDRVVGWVHARAELGRWRVQRLLAGAASVVALVRAANRHHSPRFHRWWYCADRP